MNGVYCKATLAAILSIGLLVSSASVCAQQQVYKWVDEDGVVHFSQEPPGESTEVEVEAFKTDPAPPYVPPAQTTVKLPSASETDVENQIAQAKTSPPPPVKQINISDMSLSELDRRCEDAREKKLAPLRKAEIENCIKTETGDKAWCETFWADYGDATRTRSGAFTPRMFHDLPECIEALDERNRRK